MAEPAPHAPGDAPGDAPERDLPGPYRWAVRLAELVGGLALVALMLLTVTDALMRSILNRPVLGGGDLVQVMLVVVVACSIPLCIAAGRAIAIEVLTDRVREAVRAALHRTTALIGAAALGYVAWRCYVNGREAVMFGETTMLLQIPFGPFYMVLAVAFALSALLLVLQAVRGRALG